MWPETRKLHHLGVQFKVITGDNALVAESTARQIGMTGPVILTGAQIRQMTDDALLHQAITADIFAEVEPNQKERIIQFLKKAGNVVGFMGDGINDATPPHTADVGVSVDSAVDVAKEAADIVLLEQDLAMLADGIMIGRKTFTNTMKYIFMATSANFGNMFSMAGASLIVLVVRTRLPFLKSLPGKYLSMATIGVVAVVMVLPFTPLAGVLGFVPLPLAFYGWMLLIVAAYIGSAELAKQWFYRKLKKACCWFSVILSDGASRLHSCPGFVLFPYG